MINSKDDERSEKTDRQRRKEEVLRWLDEHSDFRPFGYEW